MKQMLPGTKARTRRCMQARVHLLKLSFFTQKMIFLMPATPRTILTTSHCVLHESFSVHGILLFHSDTTDALLLQQHSAAGAL